MSAKHKKQANGCLWGIAFMFAAIAGILVALAQASIHGH